MPPLPVPDQGQRWLSNQECQEEDADELCRYRRRFSRWLDSDTFRWCTFATFTFRRTPPTSAIRCLTELLGSLSRDVSAAWWFIAQERGKVGGRTHLHALGERHDVSPERIRDCWRERYGFADVRLYDSARGATAYVGKYLVKDTNTTGEWELYNTSSSNAVDNLFTASTVLTGYQLYTRWVQLTAGSGQ